jgi:actin
VYEGHSIPSAVRRLEIAGRDLTEWMMELLNDETGHVFSTSADREIARNIKESSCVVSLNFDADLEAAEKGSYPSSPYVLPDGETIHLCKAKFCCAELLFNPLLGEKHGVPLQQLVNDSVQHCPIDLRRTLLNNVILSGGSTMFADLDKRLQAEIATLCNPRVRNDVRVIAPNERKFSVWMGAALLSSLTSFTAEWVTRQEYEEHGASIVHRRCDALTFVER